MDYNLVPGRSCGECRVCCELLHIDTEEIRKASGLLCRNYKDGGCAIYETRPKVCRGYYCGWRLLADVHEDWRPDKCNILVGFRKDGIPEGFTDGYAIEYTLLKPEAISNIELARAVMRYVMATTPVFIKALGPPGYNSTYGYVNDTVYDAAMTGNVDLVHKALKTFYDDLASFTTRKSEFTATLNPGVEPQE